MIWWLIAFALYSSSTAASPSISSSSSTHFNTPRRATHNSSNNINFNSNSIISLEQAYAVNGDKFSTFPVSSILLQSTLLCSVLFFCYFLVNVLFSNKKITFDVDIYSFLMHSHSYSSHDSSIDVPSSLSIEKIWLFEHIWMKTNIWKILSRMGYTTAQSKSILHCRGWMNQDDANRIE